jgi:stage IV sporulation protein A
MENFDLYQDIAARTNGDIYVGVVGPVRAGKSTFITKFMEALVIPNIVNKNVRERAIDELPQAAAGKTIMTTQPKFVPNEAAKIKIRDNIEIKVRMVDCVGYLVEGVQGHKENSKPRLVKTPWSDAEMPFEEAAELGTRKVITEHSTIGVLITSDGTIGTEIPRSAYVKSEEKVVAELKATGKPFLIVLNTTNPLASETIKLKNALAEKYNTAVLAIDVLNLKIEEINLILESILLEFPIRKLEIEIPNWLQTLSPENSVIKDIIHYTQELAGKITKMRDYALGELISLDNDNLEKPIVSNVSLGEGKVIYSIKPKDDLFFSVLSEECGCEIDSDFKLMSYIKQVADSRNIYEKLKMALQDVEEKGYGVVSPSLEEMTLEEPEIVRQGSRFGVRLKASAPSLHIMKVDLETEVSPIVGTEQQSEDLVRYLLSEFENDPKGIWDTEMFGKSLHKLVKEGLTNKLNMMPQEAQKKMRKTLSRIVNEGRGGVICILL